MRKLGLVVLVIGIAVTILAGVNFVTREKVVEIGSMQMMADQSHTFDWSPFLGVGIMVAGVILFIVSPRSKL
ncbi:MAG: putative membrane protein [Marinoscillum sp.]|jgi:uncharacterized membrane protein